IQGKTESRGILHTAALDTSGEVPILAPDHSIERVARTGHDAPHKITRLLNRGVGSSSNRTGSQSRIVSYNVVSRTREGAARTGLPVETHSLRRIESLRHEIVILMARIVLRIDEVEPHPVIERQPAVDLPVVLQIPLDVGRTILPLEDA